MPFLLLPENLDATWVTCKSHFIVSSETGVLKSFSDLWWCCFRQAFGWWRQSKVVLILLDFLSFIPPLHLYYQEYWIFVVSLHSCSGLDSPACCDSHLLPDLPCFSITLVCCISHQENWLPLNIIYVCIAEISFRITTEG